MNEKSILLAHILKKPLSYVVARPDLELEEPIKSEFESKLKRLDMGEPLAYLIGEKDFWSHTFKVTQDVLIPRADTECLVELALNHAHQNPVKSICDLGTGSGAIAISLKSELKGVDVCAVDKSSQALEVATENAARILGSEGAVEFVASNWFEGLEGRKFDVIVSNPPYIAENDPHLKTSIKYEPVCALTSGVTGLDDITHIALDSQRYLNAKGALMVEHGFDQGKAVREILKRFGYQKIQTHQDLSGNDRVTVGLIL